MLEQYLRLYVDYQQKDWVKLLPLAEFTYNNTPHSSTTVSPFFANKGYHPRITFTPTEKALLVAEAQKYSADLSQLHQFLREEVSKANEAAASSFNRHHLPTPSYNKGDMVWLNAKHIKTKRPTKKLDHRFLGPFEIDKKISSHAYRLKLPADARIHDVFHVELLEPVIDNQIPDRIQSPPPAVEIEGEEEYEVEAILDHKHDRRFSKPLRYLVKWLGYNDTTWEPVDNLDHAPQIWEAYNRKHQLGTTS